MKPRLLDLFSGAGGASMGYYRAGFKVYGIDYQRQPHYPFHFLQTDAIEAMDKLLRGDYLTFYNSTIDDLSLKDFDALHASPPCQAYTNVSNRWRGIGGKADSHPDLLSITREALIKTNKPYVIENVVGSPIKTQFILHGGMFGLGVHRARVFESNVMILVPKSTLVKNSIGVYGDKPDGRRLSNVTKQRAAPSLSEAQKAMGIDWMDWIELKESVPPTYTEYIGQYLMRGIGQ